MRISLKLESSGFSRWSFEVDRRVKVSWAVAAVASAAGALRALELCGWETVHGA